ncbi:hypothetical protein FHU38_003406 [Saccharomonospora amisosensis]|uniref:Uncharacterized protein n=1 Tax=Saccharomonospora amisosensis TaxID=1128677 RepID=A0A7X5ZRP8_9PSEU|nr:hypothetical protein [Saccharomonospora amisosensis]NIJ13062.1 hypothetical protein [Saccharomonospora amisosensis]
MGNRIVVAGCVALATLTTLLAYRWRCIARRETRTHLELLTAIRFAPATHPEVAAMLRERCAALLAAVDEHTAGGEQR